MNQLEVVEGLQYQASSAEVKWTIDTSKWGGSASNPPSNPSAKVYVEGTEQDVSSTKLTAGTPTINDQYIILTALKSLDKGNIYRVEVKFTLSGNIDSCYFRVRCDF